MALARSTFSVGNILRHARLMSGGAAQVGDLGAGAGKGGGKGGSIRDAGGSFGRREAAQEEEYFRKLQAKQLKDLNEHLADEVSHHEKEIKRHKEAIERHKKQMTKLNRENEKKDD